MEPKDFVTGSYGADKIIPHAYRETNWPCFPGTCACTVLNQECAQYVSEHLNRHFSSSMPLFKRSNPILMDSFMERYVGKFVSNMKPCPSSMNLSFGNFGLFKIDTPLPDIDYMLIHPDNALHVSLDSVVGMLEEYLVGHGILPDSPSEHTVHAYDKIFRKGMRSNDNHLSGIYMCTPVTMTDGSRLCGYELKDEVVCHFKKTKGKNHPGFFDIWEAPFRNMDIKDVALIRPVMKEFVDRFGIYLYRLETMNDRQTPARKEFDRICGKIDNNPEIKKKI